jgi:hypothetical protein
MIPDIQHRPSAYIHIHLSRRREKELEGRLGYGGGNKPLTHDFPVHSTLVLTTTFVPPPFAHVKQLLVLTLNTPPEGTSGVRVVVTTET